jgi:Domain of unknown function (DUF6378)
MQLVKDREKTHGNYQTQSALAQKFKKAFRSTPNWEKLNEQQAEALEAMAVKLARILAGDANYKDHWMDLQGYAFLGSDYSPMIPGMPKPIDFTSKTA